MKVDDVVVRMHRHECMVVYAFVMHVSVHKFLCVRDVVVVVMHEVMVCVVDMVMHC